MVYFRGVFVVDEGRHDLANDQYPPVTTSPWQVAMSKIYGTVERMFRQWCIEEGREGEFAKLSKRKSDLRDVLQGFERYLTNCETDKEGNLENVFTSIQVGNRNLWPVCVRQLSMSRYIFIVPYPDQLGPTVSPFLLPCITGTMEFLDGIASNPNILKDLSWYLQNMIPFGTPIETDENVLDLITSRTGHRGYAAPNGIRFPSWKPLPSTSSSGIISETTATFDSSLRFRGLPPSRTLLTGTNPLVSSKTLLAFKISEEITLAMKEDRVSDGSEGWQIVGRIECMSRLEGIPTVTIGLDGLENLFNLNLDLDSDNQIQVKFFFHDCVQSSMGPIPSRGKISFIPLLGRFDLCHYRVCCPSRKRLNHSLHTSFPKSKSNDDNASVSTRSSSLRSSTGFSVADRGRYEARLLRDGGMASLVSIPNVPVSGRLEVGLNNHRESRPLHFQADRDNVYDVRFTLHTDLTKLSEEERVVIHLQMLGNEKVKDFDLKVTQGSFALSQDRKNVVWTIADGNNQIQIKSPMQLNGFIVQTICEQCNPFAREIQYENATKNTGIPIQATISLSLQSAKVETASGITLRESQIEITPVSSQHLPPPNLQPKVFHHMTSGSYIVRPCKVEK